MGEDPIWRLCGGLINTRHKHDHLSNLFSYRSAQTYMNASTPDEHRQSGDCEICRQSTQKRRHISQTTAFLPHQRLMCSPYASLRALTSVGSEAHFSMSCKCVHSCHADRKFSRLASFCTILLLSTTRRIDTYDDSY